MTRKLGRFPDGERGRLAAWFEHHPVGVNLSLEILEAVEDVSRLREQSAGTILQAAALTCSESKNRGPRALGRQVRDYLMSCVRQEGGMWGEKIDAASRSFQPFSPESLIVERSVVTSPMAVRVRTQFPKIPLEEIDDFRAWKVPGPMTEAKRILALVRHRGSFLKPFPKIRHAVNCGDYVFNPVSNCHLECTYCILQSYLKNNPVLTLAANIDDFLQAIEARVREEPERIFRIGTGELSDSLALDDLTSLSRELVPFFARLPNAFLELKTKSDRIGNLLELDSRGHTVVSWSLMPEVIAMREELKCASITERIDAAARIQAAGYPVGLHLDPMIHFDGWQEAYQGLMAQLSDKLDPRRIAWVSIGSLRFDRALKEVATQRFPKTKIFADDFIAAPDGKMRYFKKLRIEMYRQVWHGLRAWSDEFPHYLSMEPAWMWEEVTGAPAPEPLRLERTLTNRLGQLSNGQSRKM